ncbi:MAG: RidA family protein [Robiginitomaculum sp.]
MSAIEQRIKDLSLNLPKPAAPVANYVPYVITGNHVFVSGQISVAADGSFIKGRLGENLSVAQGQAAAKLCGLNLIAQLKAACDGELNRVKRIVKIGGFVNSSFEKTDLDIPKIINGCSDLMVDVFGERGKHARFAVAASSLPLDVAVEIDCIAEIEN